MNRNEVLECIKQHINKGDIGKCQTEALEFNSQYKRELSFTSRQIEGLKLLDSVIDAPCSDIEEPFIEELREIKYIIEQSIINLTCEKYSETLQSFEAP